MKCRIFYNFFFSGGSGGDRGVVLKQGDLQFGGEVTIYDFHDYYVTDCKSKFF